MEQRQKIIDLRTQFLKKHNLRIRFGNMHRLTYVTDGNGFLSERLGMMLGHPEKCNFNPTREFAFIHLYGGNKYLVVNKAEIQKPYDLETELLADCYEMWKEELLEPKKQ